MGSFTRFRKAYGALKDSTTVGLASINSDFKDLDIAIVKATSHVEAPPKERHLRKIFAATSVVRPPADVAYCIHALSRRLAKTRNWIVAMKVLMVFHRILREGDPSFKEELRNCSYGGHIFHVANFKDDSSARAIECAGWVRTYALYIEERLECSRILRHDIENGRVPRDSNDATKVYSRSRLLTAEELLEQLPALQQLIYRLVGCQPNGRACNNYLIQYSLAMILKESFKIYCAINDGIISLVDLYFEMPKHEAMKALGIYKRSGKQTEILAEFYEFCKRLELGKNFQFPTLMRPPPSFCETMEEYLKEAPQTGSVVQRQPIHEDNPEEVTEQPYVEETESEYDQEDLEPLTESEASPLILTEDLLGLYDMGPQAEEIEESTAQVAAITSNGPRILQSDTGNDPQSLNSELSDLKGTGWELALVSSPSNLGRGFNKLSLDSLYENNAAERQIQMQNTGYGSGHGSPMQNPFKQQPDPFAMSNSIAPPTKVQMSTLAQHQQPFPHQQMYQQPPFQQHPQNMYQSPSRSPQQQPQNMMYYQSPFGSPEPQKQPQNMMYYRSPSRSPEPQQQPQNTVYYRSPSRSPQQQPQNMMYYQSPFGSPEPQKQPQNMMYYRSPSHSHEPQKQPQNMMHHRSPSRSPEPEMRGMSPSNPFGDPLPSFSPKTKPPHGNVGLL